MRHPERRSENGFLTAMAVATLSALLGFVFMRANNSLCETLKQSGDCTMFPDWALLASGIIVALGLLCAALRCYGEFHHRVVKDDREEGAN